MPYRTREAKRNLREGIKKMESKMSAAAQVRREFRLGRPPKTVEQLVPMHRTVVWNKATEALANLRSRMSVAGLNPADVAAAIIYVKARDPEEPLFLKVDGGDKEAEEWQAAALEALGGDDVFALGMIFGQYDRASGQQTIFPFQFTGLSEAGVAVLRKAATEWHAAIALCKTVN
jgi:hypothetical protein